MKYKVGNKVKIKTWEQMEKEYGVDCLGSENIPCDKTFVSGMERDLNNLNSNRILTIENIVVPTLDKPYYIMKEIECNWSDDMIEGLISEDLVKKEIIEPILNRFEILDL